MKSNSFLNKKNLLDISREDPLYLQFNYVLSDFYFTSSKSASLTLSSPAPALACS